MQLAISHPAHPFARDFGFAGGLGKARPSTQELIDNARRLNAQAKTVTKRGARQPGSAGGGAGTSVAAALKTGANAAAARAIGQPNAKLLKTLPKDQFKQAKKDINAAKAAILDPRNTVTVQTVNGKETIQVNSQAAQPAAQPVQSLSIQVAAQPAQQAQTQAQPVQQAAYVEPAQTAQPTYTEAVPAVAVEPEPAPEQYGTWVADPSSGMWYDTATGAWYDPQSNAVFDPNTQAWYSYDELQAYAAANGLAGLGFIGNILGSIGGIIGQIPILKNNLNTINNIVGPAISAINPAVGGAISAAAQTALAARQQQQAQAPAATPAPAIQPASRPAASILPAGLIPSGAVRPLAPTSAASDEKKIPTWAYVAGGGVLLVGVLGLFAAFTRK
jgi:hypothetical protein